MAVFFAEEQTRQRDALARGTKARRAHFCAGGFQMFLRLLFAGRGHVRHTSSRALRVARQTSMLQLCNLTLIG
jgi:hypothetical protein